MKTIIAITLGIAAASIITSTSYAAVEHQASTRKYLLRKAHHNAAEKALAHKHRPVHLARRKVVI